MAIMFGEEVSTERFLAIYRRIADLPVEQILEGIAEWSKYGHRFPVPAQIRDAAKGIIPGQPRRIRNRENWQ